MAFVVMADACIACGTCKVECPNEAIISRGGSFAISDECVECGTCFECCPSGAIVDA